MCTVDNCTVQHKLYSTVIEDMCILTQVRTYCANLPCSLQELCIWKL